MTTIRYEFSKAIHLFLSVLSIVCYIYQMLFASITSKQIVKTNKKLDFSTTFTSILGLNMVEIFLTFIGMAGAILKSRYLLIFFMLLQAIAIGCSIIVWYFISSFIYFLITIVNFGAAVFYFHFLRKGEGEYQFLAVKKQKKSCDSALLP